MGTATVVIMGGTAIAVITMVGTEVAATGTIITESFCGVGRADDLLLASSVGNRRRSTRIESQGQYPLCCSWPARPPTSSVAPRRGRACRRRDDGQPDRLRINMQKAVDKVGNSAAAVRKELGKD